MADTKRLTRKQAANYLNLPYWVFIKLVNTGQIPAHAHGSNTYFLEKDLSLFKAATK